MATNKNQAKGKLCHSVPYLNSTSALLSLTSVRPLILTKKPTHALEATSETPITITIKVNMLQTPSPAPARDIVGREKPETHPQALMYTYS